MVRIATSGMYYPGTMERAVLVAGEIDGVKVGKKTTILRYSSIKSYSPLVTVGLA